jgi:hypothetical protein
MLTEKEVTFLEEQIPYLAETATKQSYWRSLAESDKVIMAEKGKLIEVSSDGSRKIIKEIEKPIAVIQKKYIITK